MGFEPHPDGFFAEAPLGTVMAVIAGAQGASRQEAVAGIDPRVPRFSQAMTGGLLLVAFLVSGSWSAAVWAVPLLGLFLGMGAVFGPRLNLWGVLFRRVVVPMLRLGPPTKRKDPAPPRFAMVLGTVFLGVASLLLLAAPSLAWLGWVFALVVAALALLAAVTDICVGCEIYNLWLRGKAGSENVRTAGPSRRRRE